MEKIAVHFDCQGHSRRAMVQKLVNQTTQMQTPPYGPLLQIDWPCGGHALYHTAMDVPLVDVPCQCGDPDHWLIKWEGGEG